MDHFYAIFALLFLLSPLWMLLGFGLLGHYFERQHFANIDLREKALAEIIVTDLKSVPPGMTVQRAQLVTGSVVIAADYFKSFAASLKTLIGGEMKSLQRMQERGRREAILRMTEEARNLGAQAVANVRIETSTIAGKRRGSCAGVELIASGTALIA